MVGPTIITAIGYWVIGIPAAWWLANHFELMGIWAGIGIGLGATGIMLLALLLKALHKHQPLSHVKAN